MRMWRLWSPVSRVTVARERKEGLQPLRAACSCSVTRFRKRRSPGVLLDAVHRRGPAQGSLGREGGARFAVRRLGGRAELQGAVGVGVVGGPATCGEAASLEGGGGALAARSLQGDWVDTGGGRGYSGKRSVRREQIIEDFLVQMVDYRV